MVICLGPLSDFSCRYRELRAATGSHDLRDSSIGKKLFESLLEKRSGSRIFGVRIGDRRSGFGKRIDLRRTTQGPGAPEVDVSLRYHI